MEFKRRPWGWYLTLIDQRQFKVKILKFKAGKSCSKQRHKYRSEVWCFLSGLGVFYRDGGANSLYDVRSGDAVPVTRENWHQYTALKPTLVLEIQYGDQCIEEDIERATL